jgi:hypothetical protein
MPELIINSFLIDTSSHSKKCISQKYINSTQASLLIELIYWNRLIILIYKNIK